MAVDLSFAAWLKSQALLATATPPSAATWDGKTVSSSITSPLVHAVDAQAAAARQAAFLAGPLVEDDHVVRGRLRALQGQLVILNGDRLGYEGGSLAFVLGADEQTDGTTILTVLKRLNQ